jgi:hypothetical protein
MPSTLPTGRLGRAVALGVTLLLLVISWEAVVQPLRDWYLDGDSLLSQREALAARMAASAAQLPALTHRAAALGASGALSPTLLSGDTDAMAGAQLQEIVQGLAATAGLSPASIENLPAASASHYRRIALRLSLISRFPPLVQLLQAIAQATPHMLVDDLQFDGARLINQPVDAPIEARLTIIAFRAAEPAKPSLAAASDRQ